MKILYISKFDYPDYLNDMVFHGLKSIYKTDIEETNDATYMYTDYMLHKRSLYGKGFTVYCKLDRDTNANVVSNFEQKIENKYYDYVIYGSIWRDRSYFDLVTHHYDKSKIIALDGEDHNGLRGDLITQVTYFKRELTHSDTSIHPISFSIPKEVIRPFSFYKQKDFSTVVPGKADTYVFDFEQDYYDDMYKSKFAITKKKAGWDCLRHYEILAASCFPVFENIDEIPDRTMKFFPKKLINQYYIKHGWNDSEDYTRYLKVLHNCVKKYCTTEMSAKYVLHTAKGD